MNFLAHVYVADITNDSMLGHLLGDFVKGRAIHAYSPCIQEAIQFHRRIDSFCDSHPVTRSSRNRIGPARRRFAGILVDLCYDHFLARNWHCFKSELLTDFTRRVYTTLAQDRTPLPERFDAILPKMIAYDWLAGYFHLDHVALSLDRIADRLTCGERFKGGIADIVDNYRELQSDFAAFFPELILFAENYRKQPHGRHLRDMKINPLF
jgi:acyl carrier protein phosphodiesterase